MNSMSGWMKEVKWDGNSVWLSYDICRVGQDWHRFHAMPTPCFKDICKLQGVSEALPEGMNDLKRNSLILCFDDGGESTLRRSGYAWIKVVCKIGVYSCWMATLKHFWWWTQLYTLKVKAAVGEEWKEKGLDGSSNPALSSHPHTWPIAAWSGCAYQIVSFVKLEKLSHPAFPSSDVRKGAGFQSLFDHLPSTSIEAQHVTPNIPWVFNWVEIWWL